MLMTLKAKLALALVGLLGTLAACDGGQAVSTTTTSATATLQQALVAPSTLAPITGNADSTAAAVPPGEPTLPSSPSSGSIVGQVIETKSLSGAPGVRITVQDVREATELSGGGKTARAGAKGKFVIVLVKAESINTNGKNLGFSTTKLKDSNGMLYGLDNFDAQSAAAGETGREWSNYILSPGLSVESVLVYEVPTAASGFVLVPSNV